MNRFILIALSCAVLIGHAAGIRSFLKGVDIFESRLPSWRSRDHPNSSSRRPRKHQRDNAGKEWIRSLETDAQRILSYMTKGAGSGKGFEWLANITDTFGYRMVGQKNLEDAIDFNVNSLKQQGAPRRHKLSISAVGGSSGGEVNAPALVVRSFDELKAYGDRGQVRGKIVVYNEPWLGSYGKTVAYRYGAGQAVAYGAVAVLIRSVTPFSIYSPHTGQGISSSQPVNIPAACITVEEAEMLSRMQARGQKLQIYLKLTSRHEGTVTSRNTIFELTGSERPEEVVLLSGHFDSWDVGQGAMDDGGGCASMWHALNSLQALGFRPKRTIRVALWTAEEPGLLGSNHYYQTHKDGNEKFVFVSESDEGAFKPSSNNSEMEFSGNDAQFQTFSDILSGLVNANGIPLTAKKQGPGSEGDVSPWAQEGSPAANYYNRDKGEYYFFFHHTQADYMTVFEPGDLDYVGAVFAIVAHAYGNAPQDVM